MSCKILGCRVIDLRVEPAAPPLTDVPPPCKPHAPSEAVAPEPQPEVRCQHASDLLYHPDLCHDYAISISHYASCCACTSITVLQDMSLSEGGSISPVDHTTLITSL